MFLNRKVEKSKRPSLIHKTIILNVCLTSSTIVISCVSFLNLFSKPFDERRFWRLSGTRSEILGPNKRSDSCYCKQYSR